MGLLNKTYGILTLGCRVNHYESQVISEGLEELGLKKQSFSSPCDIYVINSCAVTEESVKKTRQMIRRAFSKNNNAFIALCGCASQLEADKFADMKQLGFICGTRNKEILVDAVNAHLKGEVFEHVVFNSPAGNLTSTHIKRFDRTRAYIKIEDGCEGKCAYCIIPKVRGGIVLRDEDEIINEVKTLADNECHEVVLTGIETSAYGKGLPALIKKISKIRGIERIRLGSLDPSFLKKEFIDAVAEIKQFCPHFHLSIQNGSDRILALMRRRYNCEMIRNNVAYIRQKFPSVNFSADIIVGFPNETEENFENTCSLVKELKLLHIHAFTYSKRPGTEASEMDGQIPENIKTERLHRLTSIADNNKNAILTALISNKEPVHILVETTEKGFLTGHTDNFIECKIQIEELLSPSLLKGRTIEAIPTDIDDGFLICKI